MAPGRFWLHERVDIDLAGTDAQENTWPMTQGLDPESALRRTIANVWFEVSHPDPDFETFIQSDGVLWSLIIWPFLEPAPPPNSIIDPGPSVLDSRMIAWGAGPGERTGDTPLGVHRYRYPGGGQPFHIDVQAQRRPPDDGGNPWVPYISWTFYSGHNVFDDVTHARIRVESTWLMDRPAFP